MAAPSAKLTQEQLEYLRELADEGVDMASLFGSKGEQGQSSKAPAAPSSQVSDSSSGFSPIRMLIGGDDEEDCVVVEPTVKSGVPEESPSERKPVSKKRQRTPSTTPRRSSRVKRTVGIRNVVVKEEEEEQRPVVPDLVIEKEFLENHHLSEVSELLKAQGWENLFEEQVLVDEDLVRQFYENLVVEEKPGIILASFTINSEDFALTSRELSLMLNVPHSGYGGYVKGQWPSTISMEEVVGRVGKDVKRMSLQTRILHRLVNQGVAPRLQKHNAINFQDYILMDKIMTREQINLSAQILQHMGHSVSTSKHGLPYPRFVKTILGNFGVYKPKSEVKAFLKFDLDNCGRLGFILNESGEWITRMEVSAVKKKEALLTGKRREEALPAAPAVDLAPVMEKLEGMTSLLLSLSEEVHVLSGRLDAMEGKLKDTAEHTQLSLSHSLKTTEFLEELNGLLNKFGTGALEQMKLAFSRRR